MFTGIVETMGQVVGLEGSRLTVTSDLDPGNLGDSVAVNGVCLTLVERPPGAMAFDLGPETLARTNLGALQPGETVNLERPLRLGTSLGGHLVQGHVDGVGTVVFLRQDGESARLRVEWHDEALSPQFIPQGSIAVDGVSLTIAALGEGWFEIMLIPHTLAATTLGRRQAGQKVNLETDMIGKYVQRYMLLAKGRI